MRIQPTVEPSLPPRPPVQDAVLDTGVERDAIIAAFVAVLFLHLLAVYLFPHRQFSPPAAKLAKVESMQVELVPAPPIPMDEAQFVHANPEVDEEIPDDTPNFSHRDQVAAQEEQAIPSEEEVPLVQGDMEDSNRIVEGSLAQQMPSMPSSSQSDDQSPMAEMQPAPRITQKVVAPDAVEKKPEAEEGMLALEHPDDNLEVPEEREFEPDPSPAENTSPLDGRGNAQNFTPPQEEGNPNRLPMSRTGIVVKDTTVGPLRAPNTSVSRYGTIAINSRLTAYGVYLNRILEIVNRKWVQLLENSAKSIQFNGSSATIEFFLKRDGTIRELNVVKSSTGRLAETIAGDAIRSPAPYPEWTPEMILEIGEETPITITFIYGHGR